MSARDRINRLEYGQLGDDNAQVRVVKLADWLEGAVFLGIGAYLDQDGFRDSFVFEKEAGGLRAVAPVETPMIGLSKSPDANAKAKVVEHTQRRVRQMISKLVGAKVRGAGLGEILPQLGGLAVDLGCGALAFHGKFAVLTAWERGSEPPKETDE